MGGQQWLRASLPPRAWLWMRWAMSTLRIAALPMCALCTLPLA